MVYDKANYERNKETHKQSVYKWRDANRKKWNEYKKKWRKENPERTKNQRKKDNKKYYNDKKNDPIFIEKRKISGQKYYQKNKEHHSLVMKKHRAKPEVKKQIAEYNKKFHQENPDLVLKNIRNHLNRLGKHHNLNWHQFLDQLRGWSEIIHKDNNETCQVCFAPSQEAHHILHKSKYPQLAFNRNNGIALCNKCHNQVHGKMLITNV